MQTVINLILSGDVSAARSWFASMNRAPVGIEATSLRNACATWGVDPAGFGVAPRPACPPELWSLRAAIMLAPLPSNPTSNDFQSAAMEAARHAPEPAHTWRMEAIRWRMGHPVEPLDCAAIQAATADTLAMFARRAS